MRQGIVRAAVLCVAIGSSALTISAWSDETRSTEANLYQSLIAAIPPDEPEQRLDTVFEQFLSSEASLQHKAFILETNGFQCTTEPSGLIEGNKTLSCRRFVEGAAQCIGLRYYSYQTAEGQILEAIGDSYVARTDIWGRCVY